MNGWNLRSGTYHVKLICNDYRYFYFFRKFEGSRRGSRWGSRRGVQKGGPGFVYTRDLVVHSKDYQPVVKRNNYTVYVKEEDGQSCFCQIKYYLKVFAKCRNAVFCGNSCSCTVPHYLAVANKLEKAELQLSSDTITHASAKHIIPVKRGGLHVIAFPLTCICKVCVFVSCDSVTDFVCHVPNRVEKE